MGRPAPVYVLFRHAFAPVKNVAVLGSKGPRQVLTFFKGLHETYTEAGLNTEYV